MSDEIREFLACLDFTWISDFQKESPRGCVLVAHGAIEQRLADLVEATVLATTESMGNFLAELRKGRNNPLGSFVSCVDYAHKRRLIDPWMAKTLRKINALRVEFAHYKPPYSKPTEIEMDQARSIFDLLPKEQQRTVESYLGKAVDGSGEHPSPRQLFLACAFLIMIILEAILHKA
jgi:hypothetical protein